VEPADLEVLREEYRGQTNDQLLNLTMFPEERTHHTKDLRFQPAAQIARLLFATFMPCDIVQFVSFGITSTGIWLSFSNILPRRRKGHQS
jgi:hypothetical protein